MDTNPQDEQAERILEAMHKATNTGKKDYRGATIWQYRGFEMANTGPRLQTSNSWFASKPGSKSLRSSSKRSLMERIDARIAESEVTA